MNTSPLLQVEALANSAENKKRIQRIEQSFGNNGQPLLIPGRALVGEGELTKMCRKKPKKRVFFLFSDILVYGTVIVPNKKYVGQHILNLEDVTVRSLADEDEKKHAWEIASPTKSFIVMAATAVEKEEWLKYMKCLCEYLHEKRGTLVNPNLVESPIWVPDYYTSVCMRCGKRFNMLNRRHHCRRCGFVVCNSCSTQRDMLPNQSAQPLRVCDTCFQQLGNSPMPRQEVPAYDQDSSDESDESYDDEPQADNAHVSAQR